MISVQAENLSKRFGSTRVFENLCFTFASGVQGVGGPNGSGKSTLLRCLSGLLRPTGGTVSWHVGDHTQAPNSIKKDLGYVAPYINLYHELSIRENLELILQLRKQQVPEDRIHSISSRLQVDDLMSTAFGDLSTGQQQRARLTCTLSYDPAILILDEPGANLDEQGRLAIRNILDEYRSRDHDRMVLLATNNPDELSLADSVFLLDENQPG
ncbi:MAG: ABC transporter ATP-binding protein [Balneolaceae bacterium]|nr:ABC transporter ATP-binding protein [Balneolaceae bacterium]